MRNVCLLLMAGIASAQPPQTVVSDRIADRFVPAPYSRQKIDGLLGERLRVNLEGRLLHLDERGVIEGFEHRPGKQAWIGEHAGKFLHAAANTWLLTQDPRLKTLMDRVARELIATQLPDGYLGTYVDDKRWTSWDVWVHKYDLIGLLSYYQATGYTPALDAARKIGDLLDRTFGDQPGRRDIVQSSTHMGMAAMSVLEPMVMLYRYTGEKRYLDFCYYITRAYNQPNGPKIIRSLHDTGSVFHTANAKAYEMMSNLVGLAELYRLTGDKTFFEPAEIAWKDIVTKRLYITGTTSSKEHFKDDNDLPADDAASVGEGCATVTWEQLNWELLRLTGEVRYAEELERTVYNQLLGAQDPHNGNICYFTPLDGKKKPTPGINCCVSSEPRGISMIPQLAWGARGSGIAVLLYTPGEVTIGDVKLKSETKYPLDGAVTLTVEPAAAKRFALDLRVPAWTANFTAAVGGKRFKGVPGQYLTIDRRWRPGDRVEIRMDMTVHVLPGGKSYPDSVALRRGPQVLALEASVNPGVALDRAVPDKTLRLTDSDASRQIYAVAGSDGKPLLLVPFADAREMRVWLRKP